jgi:ATP-dependent protease ClpP protease subunit
MTLRVLAAAPALERPANYEAYVSPKARDRWDPQVRAAAGETDNNVISIMDVIGQDWFGNGITASRVAGALRAIGKKPVTVEINSPGGDYFEGLAIYNLLREHPKDVTVKVVGIAASAAAVIAMAGDTIQVPRAGFLMIHNTMVIAYGNRNDMRATADWLEPFDAVAVDIFATRSGMNAKDVAKMLDAETWLGGSDAVDKGFADELLAADQVAADKLKNAALDRVMALRRLEKVVAAGEKLPRGEFRQLIKQISGTPGAAEEDGTPDAAENAVGNDGIVGLRTALARLKLVRA